MDKITMALIEPTSSCGLNKITVLTAGDVEVIVAKYFIDELSFTEAEFIGLTIKEAYSLRTKRDIAYLQS